VQQTVRVAGVLPETGIWELDPRHSSVRFKVVHHAVTTFRSGFGEFQGQYDAEARKLTGSAKVESVQTFEMLRNRLFEEDFFDAERYPEISFESTSIDPDGDPLVIQADLTMKGVTKRVRPTGTMLGIAPVFHYSTNTVHEHLGIDLELTIDRRDFGVSFNNELGNGALNLGWEVTLELSLEFARTDPLETT
jgi:polyisoprenoid-binding protein YceI